MIRQLLTKAFEALNKSFFKAQRERLHEMHEHEMHKCTCESKRNKSDDFIDKAHELSSRDDYQHLLEHEGLEFWTKYFEGEHPWCVLDHSLLIHRPYRLYEQEKNIADHMLTPDIKKKKY